jgi:hypothetical protein
VPGCVLAWRRGGAARVVALLIAVQVGIATFVAITMMGWWFPGRTMMTILPLFPVAIVEVVRRVGPLGRVGVVVAGAWSALTTALLALAGHRGEVVLAVDPFSMSAAPFRLAGTLFPDYRGWGSHTWTFTAAWLVAAALAVAWSVRLDPEVVGQVRAEGGDLPVDVERERAVRPALRDRQPGARHQPALLEEPHHVELELEILGEPAQDRRSAGLDVAERDEGRDVDLV